MSLDIAVFNQADEGRQLKHLADLGGGERLARRLRTGSSEDAHAPYRARFSASCGGREAGQTYGSETPYSNGAEFVLLPKRSCLTGTEQVAAKGASERAAATGNGKASSTRISFKRAS